MFDWPKTYNLLRNIISFITIAITRSCFSRSFCNEELSFINSKGLITPSLIVTWSVCSWRLDGHLNLNQINYTSRIFENLFIIWNCFIILYIKSVMLFHYHSFYYYYLKISAAIVYSVMSECTGILHVCWYQSLFLTFNTECVVIIITVLSTFSYFHADCSWR